MFWNLFRMDPRYFCLYEPFHPRLNDGILNPDILAHDATHFGVSDYWAEYRKLDTAAILDAWSKGSTVNRIRLSSWSFAPTIRRYLSLLIEETSAHGIPVLKFVMEDFRARWMAKHFRSARIIHIQRSPRDVWSSMFRYTLPDDVRERPELRQSTFFVHIDQIANSLGIRVPGHPYRMFYLIWLLSREAVSKVAFASWWYEDAVDDYGSWANKNLVEAGLFSSIPTIPKSEGRKVSAKLHSDSWFLAQEMWVYDWLGFSARKWALRHPIERLVKRIDNATSRFPFRKFRRLSAKLLRSSNR